MTSSGPKQDFGIQTGLCSPKESSRSGELKERSTKDEESGIPEEIYRVLDK